MSPPESSPPVPVDVEPPTPVPVAPAPPATYESVLSEAIKQHEATTIPRDMWMPLVEDILARIDLVPHVPTAFPLVATRMLELLRDPNVDLNALVGVVQRDAGIATSLLRVANSAAFATGTPVTTLRGAIAVLGARQVFEIVMCSAGKSLYDVPSQAEVAMFPTLWPTMFGDAIANAFTTGRLALDLPRASSERALILGLLADVGRPAALRVVTRLVAPHDLTPSDDIVAAALEEVAPEIGKHVVSEMGLPDELHQAYLGGDAPETRASRLIAAVGAIQRKSPRMWASASEIRKHAESLNLPPLVVRVQFAQRLAYASQAATMFG